DACDSYGSVLLLTTGDISFTAKTEFTKVEMVATGDIDIPAQATVKGGISLQSYSDIKFSAQVDIEGCSLVAEDQTEFEPVLRLDL
ncbi:MAG: hypothetical protein AAFU72_02090, partial [Pseudomonadota bacterium]